MSLPATQQNKGISNALWSNTQHSCGGLQSVVPASTAAQMIGVHSRSTEHMRVKGHGYGMEHDIVDLVLGGIGFLFSVDIHIFCAASFTLSDDVVFCRACSGTVSSPFCNSGLCARFAIGIYLSRRKASSENDVRAKERSGVTNTVDS